MTMQNPPKNDQEIATWLTLELSGSRLIGIRAISGDPNSFLLEFENDKAQRAGLSVVGRNLVNLSGSQILIKPGLHINLDSFK